MQEKGFSGIHGLVIVKINKQRAPLSLTETSAHADWRRNGQPIREECREMERMEVDVSGGGRLNVNHSYTQGLQQAITYQPVYMCDEVASNTGAGDVERGTYQLDWTLGQIQSNSIICTCVISGHYTTSLLISKSTIIIYRANGSHLNKVKGSHTKKELLDFTREFSIKATQVVVYFNRLKCGLCPDAYYHHQSPMINHQPPSY